MILRTFNSPLTKGQQIVHLTADIASGSGTLTVDNIIGFAVNDYILVGNFGEPTAEIIKLHASTAPTGSTITLATNTANAHYVDTPVTKIDYNQIEFSRATTLAGSKAILVTSNIFTNRLDSYYSDTTNTTGYWFWRWKNSNATVYSAYSDGYDYTGLADSSVEKMIERAIGLASVDFDSKYATTDQLIADINVAQDIITQAKDQQPINWNWEVTNDDTALTSTLNENAYALSGLSYTLKYPSTVEGIINVRFGNILLDYVPTKEFDEDMEDIAKTTLAVSATAGDTSVTLTDVSEFSDSGNILLGEDTVIYTARDTTTNILSGISASGTGSITASVSSGASVWQGISASLPAKYTVFNGYIYLNVPVSATYAGQKIKVKYLKRLDRLTDITDLTEIPFYNVIEYYVAARIEYRKGNRDEGNNWMVLFQNGINDNVGRYALPMMEETQYYKFFDE